MGCVAPLYRPRDAEHIVLHQVIAEHLEALLCAAAEAGDGAGLPPFVEREFREFLMCGVFEHGVKLIRLTFPDCEIEVQVGVERKHVDLVLHHRGVNVAIEYFGPDHFLPSRYKPDKPPPPFSERIEIIESKLGFRMRRLAVLDSSLPTHPTS